MKTTLLALVILALGGAVGYQQLQIKALKEDHVYLKDATLKVIQRIDEEFVLMNDNYTSRQNRLQDSLEERIGTLERDLEDLKFLFGTKKKRK
jgi:shikimate kinase